MSHAAVIGAGAWGTALALVLAERGPVRLHTWDRAHAAALEHERENQRFLPGLPLPDAVEHAADSIRNCGADGRPPPPSQLCARRCRLETNLPA